LTERDSGRAPLTPGASPEQVRAHNAQAWNAQVASGNRWTVPVSSAEIAAARRGEWSVVLTPTRPVPREWFPPLAGHDVLGLASGGGQQGPILAAAGARVTVYDNSEAQLAQDRLVAERDGLDVRTVRGDMANLSALTDASFDLVFHPCSNGFVPDVRPVWREACRVLRPGGVLLAGIVNPAAYLFDEHETAVEAPPIRYALPYSDLTSLPAAELARRTAANETLSFSHTLTDQIGGQLEAGFVITDIFEDTWDLEPLSRWFAPYFATRAIKPQR
jgi:SAM-dependent methyltransferase